MNTSQLDRYTLKQYTRLMISFFGCLFVLSIVQYTTLYFKGVVDGIFNTSFLIAVFHQIGFTAVTGIILVIPFNFWENLRPRYGFNLVFVLLSFLLITEAMLISYYCTTLVPLGSDLLGYSYSDIKMTIANSGGTAMYFYLFIGIVIIVALFIGLYRITSKFYHRISKMYPFTIVLFSLFVATLFTEGKPINQNKTQYLAVNLYTTSTEDHSYTADVEYPLIKRPSSENALGDYFELKDQKPNIVFIMVEGLGRDFVGEGAEYEGFTPFLDSLTTKSLYWENCLSNTGRTFGVLPSLLGSLPFGKSGFMELEEYPNKLTLYTILKNNGYHTSFYQGTNSSFDNVEKFLRSENIDFVLDKSGFGKNYELAAETSAGFTWGYPDKELFKKTMSIPREKEQPRLEVYMTISTHEPFTPPNQEHYEGIVEKIIGKRNYDSKKQKVIEKNDNVFASLLYTDDALKWLFEAYKKQPNYDNTIFIVTGDHRLIPIPQRNTISRFHVPLIIYSPMLKNTRKMSAISSHFDVTPTILSLLNSSYELKMPKRVAWMGNTLDMNKEFRSTKDIPLMRNKNELKDYVSEAKFISGGSIFEIDENMDLSSTFSGGSKLESKLDNFMAMNAYVTTNNKIIPDSLAIFTLQKEKFTEAEIVWINSVYNGKNSDKAYLTARELAFEKEYDRSLLLCRYILSEVPGNIDARILTGRINGWRGNYEASIKILKECIKTVPEYIDSYAALFDVYYWSGGYKEGLELIELVQQNSSSANEIQDKITRAKTLAKKNHIVLNSVGPN
ncbi:phosphoglycerol transferase MdoB-like AlkP superfamily enzyme [Saonia flava]|uniref:Phosphoglycerol transferase MdoB-like AlkP superfamily enzyme n=1 Tax=Saonia flava TaxID=523696 RepID=A0A846QYZ2_9FLAO|nr:LTA synthase family protein [Saonia flava]NJB69829.1 phosphoglycerol transferase MdoB-like AlkP superfamily enzyme [Saonia flava]